jgi:hypothetical protein
VGKRRRAAVPGKRQGWQPGNPAGTYFGEFGLPLIRMEFDFTESF